MGRSIKTVPEMTEALVAEKERSGYTQKLYKAESDAHKGEVLHQDILMHLTALQAAEDRTKVDFRNLDQVRQRTYDYLTACAAAEVYPSVMGLAVHGYGVSRQALNQYLLRNDNETTDFIMRTKDIMADILTNSSLYNNANAVATIFQLKNHFAHADRVEIEAVPQKNEPEALSLADIEAKYAELPDD